MVMMMMTMTVTCRRASALISLRVRPCQSPRHRRLVPPHNLRHHPLIMVVMMVTTSVACRRASALASHRPAALVFLRVPALAKPLASPARVVGTMHNACAGRAIHSDPFPLLFPIPSFFFSRGTSFLLLIYPGTPTGSLKITFAHPASARLYTLLYVFATVCHLSVVIITHPSGFAVE
jgi:hypothetical protein